MGRPRGRVAGGRAEAGLPDSRHRARDEALGDPGDQMVFELDREKIATLALKSRNTKQKSRGKKRVKKLVGRRTSIKTGPPLEEEVRVFRTLAF